MSNSVTISETPVVVVVDGGVRVITAGSQGPAGPQGATGATGPPGPGSDDHAELIHLDYDSAGHTGFAGTGIPNIFQYPQTIGAGGGTAGELAINDASGSTTITLNGQGGGVTAVTFTGSGASLTSLDAGSISSGTLSDSRLSSNVALENAQNTWTTGVQTIQTGAAATKGIIIRGAASQSANLQEWQNSTTANVAYVEPSGKIRGTTFAGTDGGFGTLNLQSSTCIIIGNSFEWTNNGTFSTATTGWQTGLTTHFKANAEFIITKTTGNPSYDALRIAGSTDQTTGTSVIKSEIGSPNAKGLAIRASTGQRSVTLRSLTSNVALLTTSVAHGFLVGQSVVVAGVDAVFNGTFTISAVTATTLSYAKVNANITSTASSGTVTVAQVAALTEWQDSGGSVLASVTPAGAYTGTWAGTAIPLANGGTGQITATAAFNALAPTQTGSAGAFLTTDGTDTSWAAPTSPISPTFVIAQGTPVTTGTNKTNVLIVPAAGTIVGAYAVAKTGPSGQALIFDINLNGTSIWASTQANRLQIAAGQTTGTQSSFDTTAVVAGDQLTIDVDQVGSGTAGQDITVQLVIMV